MNLKKKHVNKEAKNNKNGYLHDSESICIIIIMNYTLQIRSG